MLPERYDWKSATPTVPFSPLRPEFAESTYMLYQVQDYFTDNPMERFIVSVNVVGNSKPILFACRERYNR